MTMPKRFFLSLCFAKRIVHIDWRFRFSFEFSQKIRKRNRKQKGNSSLSSSSFSLGWIQTFSCFILSFPISFLRSEFSLNFLIHFFCMFAACFLFSIYTSFTSLVVLAIGHHFTFLSSFEF